MRPSGACQSGRCFCISRCVTKAIHCSAQRTFQPGRFNVLHYPASLSQQPEQIRNPTLYPFDLPALGCKLTLPQWECSQTAAGQDRRGAGEHGKPFQQRVPTWKKGLDGGRYRIRTYDFHRVKMALYR
jgi:hypothetical protein